MIVKEPRFWYEKAPPFWSYALVPLSALLQGIRRLREFLTRPQKVPCPVICIGNITVGGTGKTPVALKIASLLHAQGKTVHFLTRGYGGRLKGPVQVKKNHHRHTDVGDEALLLCETAPTWVAKHRYKGAWAAYNAGADIIIMDDGLQNPTLEKDLCFLVIDSVRGIGNGGKIPQGPLRESLHCGLRKAHAVICLGNGPYDPGVPFLKAFLRPVPQSLAQLTASSYIAFCGIGFPEKFFQTLQDLNLPVKTTYSFPDHHVYSPETLFFLQDTAQKQGARLVTTEKDAMRLPLDFKSRVDILQMTLDFEQDDAVVKYLQAYCFESV